MTLETQIIDHIKKEGCFCFGVDVRYEKLRHKREIKKIVERLYYMDDKTIEVLECADVKQVLGLIDWCNKREQEDLLKGIILNLK